MPALLRAVNQVTHRVQVQHHFHSVLGQTTRAHLQKTGGDLLGIMRQLVAARVFVVRQLQAVERRGCRQCRSGMKNPVLSQGIFLAASRRQQRIAPQLLMVVEVFIAQRLPVEPLRQQLRHRVFDKNRVALIAKAGGQSGQQPELLIDLAQEQHAAIAGERPAGKIGDYFSQTQVLKKQRCVLTLCRRRSGGW